MTNMLFRSAKESDLDSIHRIAEQAGVGMTTLPKDIKLLKNRLTWSSESFHKNVHTPKKEYYLFVLEDTSNQQIVGTSAVEASIGHDSPFYSYKLSKRTRVCNSLNIRSEYEVLSLVNDHQGRSEMCTLFLAPDYRKNYNGSLLSRSRFLFMSQFPERFKSTVIAEMRGISDESGRSPFWDEVGQHFFHMSFADADQLTLSTNKQFIADLMPRNPIYVKLLSPKAQAVIGKPHQSTIAAFKMLFNEGFRYANYVDIFDAGPTIEAPLDAIRTIASSKLLTVSNIIDEVCSRQYLLATTQLDFRATIGQTLLNKELGSCIISKQTADVLKVKCGDAMRTALL